MDEIFIRLPEDIRKSLTEEDIEFLKTLFINKILDIKIGDLLTENSKLKEEDVEKLDHLIKKRLFSRIK